MNLKPKQSFWDKVVDVFSPNTPMDQYKRQQAGELTYYDADQRRKKHEEEQAFTIARNQAAPNVYKSNDYYKKQAESAWDRMSVAEKIKDQFFDANTQADKYRRMSQGGYAEFMEDKKKRYQERGRINPLDHMIGGFAELPNTIYTRAMETPATIKGTVAGLTNNQEALTNALNEQDRLRRKYYGRDADGKQWGGFMNAGTLIDNEDEAMNIGTKDYLMRVAGGALEGASVFVGGPVLGKAAYHGVTKGAMPMTTMVLKRFSTKEGAKQALKEGAVPMAKLGAGGFMGGAGTEMNVNENATPLTIALAGTTEAGGAMLLGPASEIGFDKLGRTLRPTVNKYGPTVKKAAVKTVNKVDPERVYRVAFTEEQAAKARLDAASQKYGNARDKGKSGISYKAEVDAARKDYIIAKAKRVAAEKYRDGPGLSIRNVSDDNLADEVSIGSRAFGAARGESPLNPKTDIEDLVGTLEKEIIENEAKIAQAGTQAEADAITAQNDIIRDEILRLTGQKTETPKSAVPKPTEKPEYSEAFLKALGLDKNDVDTLGLDPYKVLEQQMKDAQTKKFKSDTKAMSNAMDIYQDLLDEGIPEEVIDRVLGKRKLTDLGDGFEFKNEVRVEANKGLEPAPKPEQELVPAADEPPVASATDPRPRVEAKPDQEPNINQIDVTEPVDALEAKNTNDAIKLDNMKAEAEKATAALEGTMDEPSFAKLLEKLRQIADPYGRIKYLQKVIDNQYAKTKGLLSDTIVEDSANGRLIDKNTGEVIAEFNPSDRYERAIAWNNARSGKRPKVKLKEELQPTSKTTNVEPEAPVEKTAGGSPPPPPPNRPKVEAKDNRPLKDITKEFFGRASKEELTYEDWANFGNKVVNKLKQDFEAKGVDFEALARKVDDGQRDGVEKLDDLGLTPAEREAWQEVSDVFNTTREYAKSKGKKTIGGDAGELYWKRGYDRKEADPLKGFQDQLPSSEKSRRGDEYQLTPDQIDYTAERVSDYILEHGDGDIAKTKAKQAQRENTQKWFRKQNPNKSYAQIEKATDEMVAVQDEANQAVRNITFGGAGMQRIVSKIDNSRIKIADKIGSIGDGLGKQRTKITERTRGLTRESRLNNVRIHDKTAGDYLGMYQWRDAGTYAMTQLKETGGDVAQLAKKFRERLETEYDLPSDVVNSLTRAVTNIDKEADDMVKLGKLTSLYERAAKTQLLENLQKIDIQDAKLKRTVDEIAVQMLRQGTIEDQFTSKTVRVINSAKNAYFRKLNVSSALNELSDLTGLYNVFGKDIVKGIVPDPSILQKYNVGLADPAQQAYFKKTAKEGLESVLKSINDKTNLYHYVEIYKASMALQAAEKFYKAKGLTGDDLTREVLKSYREITLPVDAFTKTSLDNFPLWTQYWSWNARNTAKEFKFLKGELDTGIMQDKTRAERIFRNAYANLPAKTVFWLGMNGLKGSSLLTAIGLMDYTGRSDKDYSGIQDEDKNAYDKYVAPTVTQSTTASLLNDVYEQIRKVGLDGEGGLKEKYKDANYNPYEGYNWGQFGGDKAQMQFFKNLKGGWDMTQKGYKENKNGRVQFEAPDNAFDWARAFIFGPNQTSKGREYSGKTDIIQRTKEKGNVFAAAGSMAKDNTVWEDDRYNRPLNDEYTEAYKNLDKTQKDARTAILQGGRQYNKYLDDLRREQPESYENYLDAMDGNHVDPEYWRQISNKDGQTDLTIFNMNRDRYKHRKRTLGVDYDPMYDLSNDKVKQLIRYKSAPTGEDLAHKNMLYKTDWYSDFRDKQTEYFKNKENKTDSDYKKTDRVLQWNELDKQLWEHGNLDNKEMANKYPLVYQLKSIIAEYGYDSEERKAFHRNNYEAWKAEKDKFDTKELEIINEMRRIEGYPPMSMDEYQQATEVADTDSDSSSKRYGYGSGGGFIGSPGPSLAEFAGTRVGGTIVKDGKISAPRKNPKARVSQRKIKKPKVTVRKSKV